MGITDFRLEDRLYAIACFKIFQVIWKLMLLSFRFNTCLLSSVLIRLLGLLKDAFWFEVFGKLWSKIMARAYSTRS